MPAPIRAKRGLLVHAHIRADLAQRAAAVIPPMPAPNGNGKLLPDHQYFSVPEKIPVIISFGSS